MVYEPLTPAEVAAIAEKYYLKCAPKAAAQEKPAMVLIGAQPGAGKSAVSNAVSAELFTRGGSIHVDADRMREWIDTRGGNPK